MPRRRRAGAAQQHAVQGPGCSPLFPPRFLLLCSATSCLAARGARGTRCRRWPLPRCRRCAAEAAGSPPKVRRAAGWAKGFWRGRAVLALAPAPQPAGEACSLTSTCVRTHHCTCLSPGAHKPPPTRRRWELPRGTSSCTRPPRSWPRCPQPSWHCSCSSPARTARRVRAGLQGRRDHQLALRPRQPALACRHCRHTLACAAAKSLAACPAARPCRGGRAGCHRLRIL